MGMYIGTATWKMVWRFLKKLGMEVPYDSEISLLGIYQKAMKSLS